MTSISLSVVIPAKNESAGLSALLPALRSAYPDAELIVVSDGSTDDTVAVAEAAGARVLRHPYSKGNGAAIKTGARAATGDAILFMDGDGQHRVEDMGALLARFEEGYDLVVGARQGLGDQASVARWGANTVYNLFASWMVGHRIDDLTSGMRIVNREKFLSFLYLLPNGFSYPTTSTMAFYRAGYSVAFVPISTRERVGESHINVWRDGIRFLLIIFKIGTLYSPLKLFLPVAMAIFLAGLGYYGYTLASFGRFTNMSLLLFVSSVIVFLIGLISEQISNLMYRQE
ncbi:MAG: glycosyltransferase family 2 protein [Halieaceae bacterium]|jgi:glycosyltransferase involved in cell wall biosynthesis|nr:glycosyltransferase family 2 protein [Halieaceae bacterium]